MSLLELLREKRANIKEDWLESIFRTYPLDTTGFLRKKKSQFENPVGYRTELAVDKIVDAVLEDGLDSEAVTPPLDDIVRIRSVQDFTPSQALGVVFFLKTAIREIAEKELGKLPAAAELLPIESKVDTLALICIDIYSQCQAQVYELRIKELKNSHSRLLERARMICDTGRGTGESK